MGLFGSSYPPGCSGGPYDDDEQCECCGHSVDDCICPECPECGEFGDPDCYHDHGLELTPEQIKGMEASLDHTCCECAAEAAAYKSGIEEGLEYFGE